MSEPLKLYGNVDLRALRGSRVITDEEGVECIQIPIDIAKLKRSGSHLYLPLFIFEKKIFQYDFMIVRSQTKDEQEKQVQTEVLGNAIFIKNYTKTDTSDKTPPSGAAGKPTGGDEPF